MCNTVGFLSHDMGMSRGERWPSLTLGHPYVRTHTPLSALPPTMVWHVPGREGCLCVSQARPNDEASSAEAAEAVSKPASPRRILPQAARTASL